MSIIIKLLIYYKNKQTYLSAGIFNNKNIKFYFYMSISFRFYLLKYNTAICNPY